MEERGFEGHAHDPLAQCIGWLFYDGPSSEEYRFNGGLMGFSRIIEFACFIRPYRGVTMIVIIKMHQLTSLRTKLEDVTARRLLVNKTWNRRGKLASFYRW